MQAVHELTAYGPGALRAAGVDVEVVDDEREDARVAAVDVGGDGGRRRDRSQRRNVGEPGRRSTATSKTAPRTQRTSLTSACGASW